MNIYRELVQIDTHQNKHIKRAIIEHAYDLGFRWQYRNIEFTGLQRYYHLNYGDYGHLTHSPECTNINKITVDEFLAITKKDTTITLANGKKIKLSLESYNALCENAE